MIAVVPPTPCFNGSTGWVRLIHINDLDPERRWFYVRPDMVTMPDGVIYAWAEALEQERSTVLEEDET